STARYFTVTGQHVPGTPPTIAERPAELVALHAWVFGAATRVEPRCRTVGRYEPAPDDAVLLARAKVARNGTKFAALWAGDTSGYASPSQADQALANLLAFWTGGDLVRTDRLFRA